jgi:hypothetical protein
MHEPDNSNAQSKHIQKVDTSNLFLSGKNKELLSNSDGKFKQNHPDIYENKFTFQTVQREWSVFSLRNVFP